MNTYFFHAATLASVAFVIYQLSTEGKAIMSLQDSVNAVVAQLNKARQEITVVKDGLTAKLADVQSQLDAAGVSEKVDLSELQSAAQALDDIVPDPVVVPITPETPADVPADVPSDAPVSDA